MEITMSGQRMQTGLRQWMLALGVGLAVVGSASAAHAECPCNIDPVVICSGGDCSELPALNYEEILEALRAHAATEGSEGDGEISCGNNFSDITAVAGIRRGSYPGSLTVRAELERCIVSQTYDDENGVMQTNWYHVLISSEADAAECLAPVHRVCSEAARP